MSLARRVSRRTHPASQRGNHHYDPSTPLDFAIAKRDKHLVELLLAHGASLNEPDQQVLRLPVQTGDNEMLSFLISKGVNPKIVIGDRRRTYLHYAVIYGHRGIAEILLGHGVDIDAKDRFGQTALHLAVLTEKEDLAALLRAHGANESL